MDTVVCRCTTDFTTHLMPWNPLCSKCMSKSCFHHVLTLHQKLGTKALQRYNIFWNNSTEFTSCPNYWSRQFLLNGKTKGWIGSTVFQLKLVKGNISCSKKPLKYVRLSNISNFWHFEILQENLRLVNCDMW